MKARLQACSTGWSKMLSTDMVSMHQEEYYVKKDKQSGLGHLVDLQAAICHPNSKVLRNWKWVAGESCGTER